MKKLLTFILILTFLISIACIPVYADGGENLETASENAGEESFFELVYRAVEEHSEKILSALAAIASLILAFAYKNGLMPSLKGAIDKLCEAVSRVKNASEDSAKKADVMLKDAQDKLGALKESLINIEDGLRRIDEDMKGNLESKQARDKLRLIMLQQTEMLYDIFMTSSLPQYQKDIVGERVAKMKEEIGDGE